MAPALSEGAADVIPGYGRPRNLPISQRLHRHPSVGVSSSRRFFLPPARHSPLVTGHCSLPPCLALRVDVYGSCNAAVTRADHMSRLSGWPRAPRAGKRVTRTHRTERNVCATRKMRVPDFFDRCIICRKEPVGDPEHIIPECIGGTLKARVLCNRCNHTLGSQLVGGLTSDPSIKCALQALGNDIPNLVEKASRRRTLIGQAEDGSIITAAESQGGIRILPSKGSGGSVLKGVEEAKEDLEKTLARRGAAEAEITEWQQRYDQLPNDTPMTTPSGLKFIKRTSPPLQTDPRGRLISSRLPALIAFEFWSLVIGKRIYEKAFDPVRQYIRDGTKSNQLIVENLQGTKYDCFHKVAMELINGCIATSIQLFRWIAFRVTFRGYDHRGADSLYYQDLKIGHAFCALTKSDATHGRWITD
jgi:hypothetical protein